MSRYMTVVLVNRTCARVVFRGSLVECQRVAHDLLRETFVLPTHY